MVENAMVSTGTSIHQCKAMGKDTSSATGSRAGRSRDKQAVLGYNGEKSEWSALWQIVGGWELSYSGRHS